MSRMAEQQLYINGGYHIGHQRSHLRDHQPCHWRGALATVQAAGREDVDRAVERRTAWAKSGRR